MVFGRSKELELVAILLLILTRLKRVFSKLEEEGSITGFKDNPEAAELWMRSNLVNMVYRGNLDKEKISSLRPIHLRKLSSKKCCKH